MGFENHNPKPKIGYTPKEHPDTVPMKTIKGFSQDVQMSDRWVREQIKLGMPHLRLGTFVRIEIGPARAWLRTKYGKGHTDRVPKVIARLRGVLADPNPYTGERGEGYAEALRALGEELDAIEAS